MIESISKLIDNRDYKNAIDAIDKIQDTQDITKEEQHRLNLYRLKILRLDGNFREAKEFAQNNKDINECANVAHLVQYNLEYAASLYRLGEIELTVKILDKVKTLLEEAEIPINLYREYYDLQGKVHLYHYELDKAMNSFQTGLKLSAELKEDSLTASMTNGIGVVYFYRGKLDEAAELYETALEINQKLSDIKQIGISLNNIGYINYTRGNYVEAIEILQHALDSYSTVEIDYYRSTALFNLIRSNILLGNIEQAESYFHQLTDIAMNADNRENRHIQILKLLSEAIIKQQGERLRDKYQAETLFEKIVDIGGERQFVIIAMIHLAEILIMELQISENDDILQKIEEIANKLNQIANEMNSVSIEIQTKILNVKLNRVRGNYREAHNAYKEILDKAEQNGLHILAEQIAMEIDHMKREVKKMTAILDQNPTVIERLDIVQFRSYLDDLKNMI